MLTLYTTPLSANGRKVMAAARLLGLDPEIRLVNVYRGEGRTPEYLAINPTGKIPTLVDGNLVLAESNAILLYLSEVHGGFRLSSRDPRARAEIHRWLFWEAAHWQPVLSELLAAAVGHRLLPEVFPEPAEAPHWDDEGLRPLLEELETRLEDREFLLGDEVTLADLAVGGMTTYFRATGFPFEPFPRITAWMQRMDTVDGWRETAVEPWA